ncbi:hypothetical protein E4413_16935 [Leptospira interrogans]|uniref:Uncharacterized protein n=1 Tax=Leptospira interrogans serovar Bataviae TaxID=312175 RepID=A0AAQ0B434_LEPIR|nr:hypothetical protein C5473_14020 [Leptospira interrogans serovar Weerasinghe]KAA1291009.1 hypothetical protein C4X99_12060 [Leptospira interrogans serovar Geyaweera]MBE0303036.1 hypothetical protein [Leptospira interrogans serovar Yeoncheon]QCO38645.1 hypothetical protein E4412_16840 [Leptospira interrogans]QEI01315.1 hypothetical protein FWJ33_19335 [Leptospira interrogans serovar Hardjo]QOI39868.1 hypothetical protein Lepto1548_17460 [Leptospira interrogans serovar Bataviae]
MFLIVIRILLAGIVGCAVTFYLQTPKVYFNASRSGVFKYSHDYTSNAIKQLRIEYEDNKLFQSLKIMNI